MPERLVDVEKQGSKVLHTFGSAIAPSFGSICNRPTSCALRSRRRGRDRGPTGCAG
jgi:hypothetical protein